MPRVPTYDNLQTSQTAPSPVPFQGSNGPNAGQIQAQQTQDMGAGVAHAGDAAGRIALDMQQQINQVRVNDAVNKARQAAQDLAYSPENGYLNLKGEAALSRPNGQALPEEYGGKLTERLVNIGDDLSNDEQRRQFQLNANDLKAQFRGQVESHMLGEFREHSISVQDGTIGLASNDAKMHWNDPNLMAPSLNAAKAAVVEKGRLSGWSASQTDAALLATTSHVHSDVVMAALANNNPGYAQAYLDRYKGQMTADDVIRIKGHTDQQVWLGQAQGAVQAATAAAMPAIAPTSFDRLKQIVMGAESGGHDFKPDGTLLEGPNVPGQGTAKGRMQVMDATAVNPGHGIAPAITKGTPQQIADDRARVGSQLLQALVNKYGDPAKAMAAYNWGEGNVDKALAQQGGNRAGAQGADWLSYAPKETRDYVTKNMAQLQGAGGQAPRPTELEFQSAALAQLPPDASAQVIKMTRDQADQQYSVISRSLAQQGANVVSVAQRWLAENNGNYLQMPIQLRDAVDRLAPGRSDNLIGYAKVFSEGVTTSDPVLLNRLHAHPSEMYAMSDPQFESLRAHLAPHDYNTFSKDRGDYLNGKSDTSFAKVNTPAMRAGVNEALAGLNIPTSPKPTDKAANERLAGIRSFVHDSLLDAQRAAGKQFTEDETRKHIDSLFVKDATFRDTLFGITTGGTSSQNLMSMQVKDLPSGAADGLRQALVRSGNKTPTDNDVLNLYRKLHAK